MRGARLAAGVHAGYLLTTGLWPAVDRRSFERVTGRKRDFWLVRTVGGLAAASGLALGVSVLRARRPPEARVLAVASAVVFAFADVHAGRRVSAVYFGDLGLQLVLPAAWLVPWDQDDGPARAG